MDWKIELVAIPVTDVDRAKAFYVDQVGFHPDHDYQVSDQLRFVQLTPPGSACSIVLGTGITDMPPGSQRGVQMVIEDAEAARRQLVERGVQASDVDVQPWGSFVRFSDPDGNVWTLQQLPAWAPGSAGARSGLAGRWRLWRRLGGGLEPGIRSGLEADAAVGGQFAGAVDAGATSRRSRWSSGRWRWPTGSCPARSPGSRSTPAWLSCGCAGGCGRASHVMIKYGKGGSLCDT